MSLDVSIERSEKDSLNLTRLSGSENVILNLAIKRACNQISAWGRSGIFIIDECLDCFDKERFEQQLYTMIQILKLDYQCIFFQKNSLINIFLSNNSLIIW